MKKVLVPLANGFEEIEAVTIIDILRRAGAEVITAGLDKKNVQGSHGIRMIADSVIEDESSKEWDLVVLPGGVPGAPNLGGNETVVSILDKTARQGAFTAAICAAPYVLEKAGLTENKKFTCHPAWEEKLEKGINTGARIQVDGKMITSKSCGTAMEFAFELVRMLYGDDKVAEVNSGVFARLSN